MSVFLYSMVVLFSVAALRWPDPPSKESNRQCTETEISGQGPKGRRAIKREKPTAETLSSLV
jgi:hypothetical protein